MISIVAAKSHTESATAHIVAAAAHMSAETAQTCPFEPTASAHEKMAKLCQKYF